MQMMERSLNPCKTDCAFCTLVENFSFKNLHLQLQNRKIYKRFHFNFWPKSWAIPTLAAHIQITSLVVTEVFAKLYLEDEPEDGIDCIHEWCIILLTQLMLMNLLTCCNWMIQHRCHNCFQIMMNLKLYLFQKGLTFFQRRMYRQICPFTFISCSQTAT